MRRQFLSALTKKRLLIVLTVPFSLISFVTLASALFFRKWVSILYEGTSMRIILNGWLTEGIPLRSGVRQGDLLSPLLNVQCVEALACQIRNCPEIRGFLLPGAHGRQARVRIYADDTTTILKDLFPLRRLFDLISIYERGSGAKLN